MGKTSFSDLDRRRFLRHTWSGVGASLSLALMPGRQLSAAPRFGATRSPSAWPRAIPRRTASCCGPGWRPSRPIPPAWASGHPRRLARGHRRAPAPRGRARRGRGPGRARALGPRRGRRPAPRARLLLSSSTSGGEESPIGHFRTAPASTRLAARAALRLRHLPGLAERLLHRLPGHAGATTSTWSSTWATTPTNTPSTASPAAGIPAPAGFEAETVDLRTYRLRHTLYKLDPDLQAAHAKFPFAVIWDDHEVQNDYSGLAPEGGAPSPEFTARRAAAYQAYYEHMPIRLRAARQPARAAAHLPAPALRQAGRVHPARRPPVPQRQPLRRRRVAALRGGARAATTRCWAASRRTGCARGFAGSRRALEHRRRSSCCWPSWSTRCPATPTSGTGTTPGTAIRGRASACCRTWCGPSCATRCS